MITPAATHSKVSAFASKADIQATTVWVSLCPGAEFAAPSTNTK